MRIQLFLTALASFLLSNWCWGATFVGTPTWSSPVAKYEKFEVDFQLAYTPGVTIFPYDPTSIEVHGVFTHTATGTSYEVPAFFYEPMVANSLTPPTGFISCESSDWWNFVLQTISPDLSGTAGWKLRFAPQMEGAWTFQIVCNETVVTSWGGGVFFCYTPSISTNKGFIQNGNRNYLKYSNGDMFFPIGMNMGFDYFKKCKEISTGDWQEFTGGYNSYNGYLDRLSDHKANHARLWLNFDETLNIVGHDTQDDKDYFPTIANGVNQKDSWVIDQIVDHAHTKGVALQMCIFNQAFFDWRFKSTSTSDPWLTYNVWNCEHHAAGSCALIGKVKGTVESPIEFFTNPMSIEVQQYLIRYIVARWGYSTNVSSWEFWNEVEQLTNDHFFPSRLSHAEVESWHAVMKDYLSAIDPFDHLISTSGGVPPNSFQYPMNDVRMVEIQNELDFAQTHFGPKGFPEEEDMKSAETYFELFKAFRTLGQNNPVQIGESYNGNPANDPDFNHKDKDPKGLDFHNALWASSMSGFMGAAVEWYYYYIHDYNLYHIFAPLGNFWEGIPLLSENVVPGYIGDNDSPEFPDEHGLRCNYLRDDDNRMLLGWVQDWAFDFSHLYAEPDYGIPYLTTSTAPPPPLSSSTTTLENGIAIEVGRPDGTKYDVTWYNASTGDASSVQTVYSASGKIQLIMPSALRNTHYGDAVFVAKEDCDYYTWRDGALNPMVLADVESDVAVNPSFYQVFYRAPGVGGSGGGAIRSNWWNDSMNRWEWSELNDAEINNVGGEIVARNGQVFYVTANYEVHNIWWDAGINQWVHSNLDGVATKAIKDLAMHEDGKIYYRLGSDEINLVYYDIGSSSWQHSECDVSVSDRATGDLEVTSAGEVIYYGDDYYDPSLKGGLWNLHYDSGSGSFSTYPICPAVGTNVANAISISGTDRIFYVTTDQQIESVTGEFGAWTGEATVGASTLPVIGDLAAGPGDDVFFTFVGNDIGYIHKEGSIWVQEDLSSYTNGQVGSNLAVDDRGYCYYMNSVDHLIHRLYYDSQCGEWVTDFWKTEAPAAVADAGATMEAEIQLFPNPSDALVNIVLPSGLGYERIEVRDMQGRLMEDRMLQQDESKVVLDTKGWAQGVYFLQFQGNVGPVVKKLVVGH